MTMNTLDELRAIRTRYGLTYERMAREMAEYVGITPEAIRHILNTGDTKLSTITAMTLWLSHIGRKRYPLGVGDWCEDDINKPN